MQSLANQFANKAALARGDRVGVAEAVRRHILSSEDTVVRRAETVRREGNPEPASFFG